MTTPQYAWRKSTRSDDGNCVEVALATESVLVRDSKTTGGPSLRFDLTQWQTFISEIHAGSFASPNTSG
ncbi:DUF397 domain-containing protein [Micromonospora sp. WMMD1102]|uniref:DUF397 domain-containing protein n=1 Tax=Micromonospora sp. WMMD1102 TaxID=3016105 RepID=UPI002414F47E|nr:DUF397 domain-containing protein [Micromonospora sp. WMMD1102]MDG4784982.1 DUF397 domain-containing protein [Micromonospora sp. WMMD1102]